MDLPSVRERFTTRSGVRIRALDNAPQVPEGLPILFSPGFSDTAEEYAELLIHLRPRRLVVVEVRGRGGSEAPTSGYAAADHAADLRAVVDELELDRFHVLSFSRGTTWALDLVLSAPQRVATVTIGDYWAREHHVPPAAAEQFLAGRFRGRPLAERLPSHVPRQVFGASVDRDLCGDLAATGIPLQVITGTGTGRVLDDATVAEYRARIPDVEVRVLEGAGHDLFRADRVAVGDLVVDFVSRRAPGT